MNSLDYILQKYNIRTIPTHNAPIELPIMREGLAELFAELEYNVGAEIGVDEGIYAEVMCKANPNLILYCVDAWRAYRGYRDYTKQETLTAHYKTALKKLSPYNCVFVQKFSMDAVVEFDDLSLDFVYIDASHEFLHVTEDIAKWSEKVKIGGIVSGHDYRRTSNAWICQVRDVVPAWIYSHKISPWFVTSIKDTQSWWWVKQW